MQPRRTLHDGEKLFKLFWNIIPFFEFSRRKAARNAALRENQRADGGSVLSVLEGTAGLCIHSVEPSSSVKFTAHRGMAVPLSAGATGKILLAYAPPEVRSKVLSSSPDPAALEKEIELIRHRGYASSREEWIAHAGDISVPLFDGRGRFVAQLGVAGIAEQVFRNFDENLRLLKSAAQAVEQRFEKTMEVV